MPFKRDLALQNKPLSKQPFKMQSQFENEDVTWSPPYTLPNTRTNKRRALSIQEVELDDWFLSLHIVLVTYIPHNSCMSFVWVLYFISCLYSWIDVLNLNQLFNWRAKIWEPLKWNSYEGFNLEHCSCVKWPLRASPPILENGWLELILWAVACKSTPPILQNGWFVGRAGLEVEVGLQIGVNLQVGAPPPQQKRSPLNNKGQTPYSFPISKSNLAFVSPLFYHIVYKSWVGHSACKPTDLNLLWGWSTLHLVGWVVMLLGEWQISQPGLKMTFFSLHPLLLGYETRNSCIMVSKPKLCM